jgi:acyl carrier protein
LASKNNIKLSQCIELKGPSLETFEVLKGIIVEKFDKNPDDITLESTLETLEIDSLDVFDIIFEAEEKFDITVPNEDVAVNKVGDVVALIDRIRAQNK